MLSIVIIILFMFVIMAIIWFITNKVKIKYKTFTKKGFKPVRGNFGVYCYCGKQGTGKTYSVVEYLLDNKEDILVFCNIKDIEGLEYTYFTGFKELIKIKELIDSGSISTDKQIVIVYDEIFTELQRYSKLNKEVLDFLCQMRKRQIIFLTTCQEWAELPLTWRRFCRYQIQCKMITFFVGILIKEFHDAENMKWSNDDQEHIAPLLETTISKCRLSIANSYDTFLRISSSSALLSSQQTQEAIDKLQEVEIPSFLNKE